MLTRRPLLLNSVVLRQNPHNVYEWLKRIKILKQQYNQNKTKDEPTTTTNSNTNTNNDENDNDNDDIDDQEVLENQLLKDSIAETYADAVKTINPHLAIGKLSHVWIGFAKFFERSSDINSSRSIFKKATQIDFKSVDELANVWCAWVEMEIRLEEYEKALLLLQKVVSDPPRSLMKKSTTTTITTTSSSSSSSELIDTSSSINSNKTSSLAIVYKNVKIWNLYLDLEESIGTIDTCRSAYERVIDIKVATPQMMLNYASYLEEKQYFDDSFRVYEKAVTMFVFPQLRVIWLTYFDKFIARFGGTKIERLRDMFENAVTNIPEEYVPEFYIKYAKIEEELGLSRQAIAVYDRACRVVSIKERLSMYRLYAKKMEQYYGVTKARPVYERAIAELGDDDCREICIEFAEMETKLGEVDRARTLYQYGSQFAIPSRDMSYWNKWKEFEEANGNEDSYREMLRIKRSVETFNSQVRVRLGVGLLIF